MFYLSDDQPVLLGIQITILYHQKAAKLQDLDEASDSDDVWHSILSPSRGKVHTQCWPRPQIYVWIVLDCVFAEHGLIQALGKQHHHKQWLKSRLLNHLRGEPPIPNFVKRNELDQDVYNQSFVIFQRYPIKAFPRFPKHFLNCWVLAMLCIDSSLRSLHPWSCFQIVGGLRILVFV